MPEELIESAISSESKENRPNLSRRQVLVGGAIAAIAAGVPKAMASAGIAPAVAPAPLRAVAASDAPIRRYMAASALLPDGRMLITGGYSRAWSEDRGLRELASTIVFDPSTGESFDAAPMRTSRARHAAVSLRDGRVVVIGGLGQGPLASVEVYDPRRNRWEAIEPLAQGRYDHTAVADGSRIIVMGGSARSMVTSAEIIDLDDRTNTFAP